jgi:hypothetical protein
MESIVETIASILPEGLEITSGCSPPPPVNFEDGYRLPPHCEKPLQKLHPHPLDVKLSFFEKPHVYTFEGIPLSGSVTFLAHLYEEHFDADKVILNMRCPSSFATQSWPRLEYVIDPQLGGLTAERGALLVRNDKTIASIDAGCMEENASSDSIESALRCLVRPECGNSNDTAVDLRVFSFERSKTLSEIKKQWKDKANLASNLGTEGHFQCELCLNGLPCRWWEPEIQTLLRFAREELAPRGIFVWNTEKEIVCRDADIGGSIDVILWDTRKQVFHILDYKRSDKLANDMCSAFRKKLKPPLQHLDDCSGAKYALQTSIYQWILERDYNMPVGDRILLSIHPDSPFQTSVPYLREEVDYIMQERLNLVQARADVARTYPQLCCSRTGAPLVDAVRICESGILVMQRVVLLSEETYEIADDIRRVFDEQVESRMRDHSVHVIHSCEKWQKKMPKGGRAVFE